MRASWGPLPAAVATACALVLGPVALAAVPGCTLALPYGEPRVEAGAGACTNDLDDDFDGRVDCDDEGCDRECVESSAARCENGGDDDGDTLVDCDDPSCAGHCPETTLSACSNERDDDGDGRLDALDAECWPVATVEIERCASVLGGALDVHALALNGTVELAADPTGRFAHDVVVTRGRPAVAEPPILVPWIWSTNAVAGAVEGTEARFTFHTGVRGGAIGVGELTLDRALGSLIAVSIRPTPPPTSDVRVLLHTEVAGVATTEAEHRLPSFAARWVDVVLRVAGGVVTAELSVDGAPIIDPLSVALAPGFPPAAPMRVVVEGSTVEGEAPSLFASASVVRPHLERCGALAPPFGVRSDPLFPGAFAWTTLDHVVRGADRTLCALGATHTDLGSSGEPGYYSYVSTDDGVHWTRSRELTTPATGGQVTGALGYDREDGRFHAVLQRAAAGGASLLQAESTDCVDWAVHPTALDPSDGGRFDASLGPVRYRVEDGEHVLTLEQRAVGGDFALYEARSPWGFPGTWTYDETPDRSIFEASPGPPGATSVLGLRVHDVGRDEVAVVNGHDGMLALWVRGDDARWREVPGFHLGPSGEARAFDAHVVLLGALLDDAPDGRWWTGRVFYGGHYDAESRGWGWANVRIGLPGTE